MDIYCKLSLIIAKNFQYILTGQNNLLHSLGTRLVAYQSKEMSLTSVSGVSLSLIASISM